MSALTTSTQVAPPFASLYLHHKLCHVFSDVAVLYQSRYIAERLRLVREREDTESILSSLKEATNMRLTWQVLRTRPVYMNLVVYKWYRFATEKRLDLQQFFKPKNKLLYLPAHSSRFSHVCYFVIGICKYCVV